MQYYRLKYQNNQIKMSAWFHEMTLEICWQWNKHTITFLHPETTYHALTNFQVWVSVQLVWLVQQLLVQLIMNSAILCSTRRGVISELVHRSLHAIISRQLSIKMQPFSFATCAGNSIPLCWILKVCTPAVHSEPTYSMVIHSPPIHGFGRYVFQHFQRT